MSSIQIQPTTTECIDSTIKLSEVMRNFAVIVRSEPAVRTAFGERRLTRLWWRAILGLHGRPRAVPLPAAVQRRIVARGFALYGLLYRVVSFGVLGVGLLALSVYPQLPDFATYTCAAGLGSWALLWLGSKLLSDGAAAYGLGVPAGRTLLTIGLTMTTTWLGIALGLGTAAVCAQGWVPAPLASVLASAAMLLGVNSSCLELVYLNSPAAAAPRGPGAPGA